ncbi:hypothetical protein KCH_13400 [Kitasatospora cheerisanensis KCTC 2395]|uniref:Uncharacterized protein n=1 Tax=Kitasatospora cheerisanensis KCTC 2395 TaxID=1348663 RepID=A0A066Z3S1_9ACTN|nr:hypothetical protein KCH_13400 [Kitasatospora cheerisanensis KCTC 2395]
MADRLHPVILTYFHPDPADVRPRHPTPTAPRRHPRRQPYADSPAPSRPHPRTPAPAPSTPRPRFPSRAGPRAVPAVR